MKVAICGIGKFEEDYLLEWVEHYKNIGVDNIIFFDNSNEGDYRQYSVLKKYIDNGFVIYKDDFLGEKGGKIQINAYEKCLIEYSSFYNWIGFFDVDEFIELDTYKNIKDFLFCKKFLNHSAIAIKWKIYDDNGIVYKDDNRCCEERFILPKINRKYMKFKTFVNTDKIKKKKVVSVHHIIKGKKCDFNGIDIIYHPTNNNLALCEKEEKIFIKHYKWKSIEEFIRKIERGDINGREGFENASIDSRKDYFLKSFFKHNKITFEKIKYALKKCYSYKDIEKEKIFIKSWCKFDLQGEIVNRNLGDDLNWYLFPKMFPNIEFCRSSMKKDEKKRYFLIGSFVNNDYSNCVIWGGGIQKNNLPENINNCEVLCVRGPITRKKLLDRGVNCPEKYGDPALLLPHIYSPQYVEKKYDIGIIPHHSNIENEKVKKFIENNKGKYKIKIIKFNGYNSIEDTINNMLSCKYILSESLYGIIISDAYNIPNIKINITNRYGIKYEDYYKSINREMIEFDIFDDIDKIIKKLKKWKRSKEIKNRLIDLYSTIPFLSKK